MLMDGKKLLYDKYFELLSFLITSARGLFNEPEIYGPLRLVETAEKLLEIMEEESISNRELVELKKYIHENIDTVLYGEEEFKKFLDEVVKRLALIIRSEVKRN